MDQLEATPGPEPTCWECHAPNDPSASECWLCQRRDWRTKTVFTGIAPVSEIARSPLGLVTLAVVLTGTVLLAPGLGILLLLLVAAWALTEWRSRRRQQPGLRLIPFVKDAREIPLGGKSLIVVAAVNKVLHFRIVDSDGNMVVDADETELSTQSRPTADLAKQLECLWPPHRLTEDEKTRVIALVCSIFGFPTSFRPMSPERKLPLIVGTMALIFILLIVAIAVISRG